MHTAALILMVLVLWWVGFCLLVLRDYRRRPQHSQPQPVTSPDETVPIPRWPSWRDCLACPTLFLFVPCLVLFHVVLFILIWPSFVIHRLYFSRNGDEGSQGQQ